MDKVAAPLASELLATLEQDGYVRCRGIPFRHESTNEPLLREHFMKLLGAHAGSRDIVRRAGTMKLNEDKLVGRFHYGSRSRLGKLRRGDPLATTRFLTPTAYLPTLG